MTNPETTRYKSDPVLLELYEALKKLRQGDFANEQIGVGILDTEASAVYLAVERRMEGLHG